MYNYIQLCTIKKYKDGKKHHERVKTEVTKWERESFKYVLETEYQTIYHIHHIHICLYFPTVHQRGLGTIQTELYFNENHYVTRAAKFVKKGQIQNGGVLTSKWPEVEMWWKNDGS